MVFSALRSLVYRLLLYPLARFLRRWAEKILPPAEAGPSSPLEELPAPPADWIERVKRGAPELLRKPARHSASTARHQHRLVEWRASEVPQQIASRPSPPREFRPAAPRLVAPAAAAPRKHQPAAAKKIAVPATGNRRQPAAIVLASSQPDEQPAVRPGAAAAPPVRVGPRRIGVPVLPTKRQAALDRRFTERRPGADAEPRLSALPAAAERAAVPAPVRSATGSVEWPVLPEATLVSTEPPSPPEGSPDGSPEPPASLSRRSAETQAGRVTSVPKQRGFGAAAISEAPFTRMSLDVPHPSVDEVEPRWPELPDEPPPNALEWADAARTTQRAQRLEREQRGERAWSE
jgi:hypothetical protein